MKINYELKRFLKRNIKKVLRFIIYFGILFSFSINSFALSSYEFKDYDSFVNDGYIEVFVGDASPFSALHSVDEFYDDLNDISVAYEEEPLVGTYPFKSFAFTVHDSSNVNVDFNSNDVVILRHKIGVSLHGARVSSSYDDYFRITINYTYGNNQLGSLIVSGSECLEKAIYSNYSDYSYIEYTVNLNKVLPSFKGTITSIRYDMYNITSQSYSLRFYPSGGDSIVYFVGDSSNAPIYTSPNGDSINDYHDKEQQLLDDTDSSAAVNNIFQNFSSFFRVFGNGLLIITSFMEIFLAQNWLKYLLYVSLALGVFSYLLSIGVSSLGRVSSGFGRNNGYKSSNKEE